jgi:hypothetical protein
MTKKQIKEVEEIGFDRLRIGKNTYSIVGYTKEKGNITAVNVLNAEGKVYGVKFPVRVYDTDIQFYNSEKSPVRDRSKSSESYYIKYVK